MKINFKNPVLDKLQDIQTVVNPVFGDVVKEMKMNKKHFERVMDETSKEVEDASKDVNAPKAVVTPKVVLEERLFEDYDPEREDLLIEFEHDVYKVLTDLIFKKYRYDNFTEKELEVIFERFVMHYFEADEFNESLEEDVNASESVYHIQVKDKDGSVIFTEEHEKEFKEDLVERVNQLIYLTDKQALEKAYEVVLIGPDFKTLYRVVRNNEEDPTKWVVDVNSFTGYTGYLKESTKEKEEDQDLWSKVYDELAFYNPNIKTWSKFPEVKRSDRYPEELIDIDSNSYIQVYAKDMEGLDFAHKIADAYKVSYEDKESPKAFAAKHPEKAVYCLLKVTSDLVESQVNDIVNDVLSEAD